MLERRNLRPHSRKGRIGCLRRGRGAHVRAAGFSLTEGLVAAALVGTIAVSVVPLFTGAMVKNEAGSEYSRLTNAARDRLEEFSQLPFNSEPLTLTTGSERVYSEYFSFGDRAWKPGTAAEAKAANDPPLMARTTTVRQFNVNDLATPLDVGAAAGAVQLKEIVVQAESAREAGALGAGKTVTVRLFKSR